MKKETKRLKVIKAAQKKHDEVQEMKDLIAKIDARKAEIKLEQRDRDKTRKPIINPHEQTQPKSKGLEVESMENLQSYTNKEVDDYLAGSVIMENYNATKNNWD